MGLNLGFQMAVLTMNCTLAICGGGKHLSKTLMAWAVEYPLLSLAHLGLAQWSSGFVILR